MKKKVLFAAAFMLATVGAYAQSGKATVSGATSVRPTVRKASTSPRRCNGLTTLWNG